MGKVFKGYVLFLFVIAPATSAQEIPSLDKWENISTRWSIALAYSPQLTFSFDRSSYDNPGFMSGVGLMIYRRQNNERVSLSLGSIYRHRSTGESQLSRVVNVTLIEFPVQVNYHLNRDALKYDPYVKSSIRLSYLKYRYPFYVDPGGLSPQTRIDYPLSIDFGYGTSIKMTKNVSLMVECNLGYRISYPKSDRYYFDALTGLKYNF